MGKTAVVTALVLAAKASPKERRPAEQGNLTVVLANNTLVGQWVDEIKKFAPGLSVVQAYGGKKLVSPLTDVVVTTPNCSPSAEMLRYCTRLVLDESHLYEPKSQPKLPATKMTPLGGAGCYSPRRGEYPRLPEITRDDASLSLNGQAPLARHRHALLQLDQPAADAGFDARTLEARPRAVEVCVARNDRRPGQRPLRRQAQEADGAALPPPPPHPILHAAHGRFAAPSTSTRASTIAPSVAATNRHTAEGPSPLQVRHTKAQRIGGEEALPRVPERTRESSRTIESHRDCPRLGALAARRRPRDDLAHHVRRRAHTVPAPLLRRRRPLLGRRQPLLGQHDSRRGDRPTPHRCGMMRNDAECRCLCSGLERTRFHCMRDCIAAAFARCPKSVARRCAPPVSIR